MNHWLLMFKPETYELVQEHRTIGVLHNHRRRFAELKEGDRFIAYISRKRVLDGHGRLAGDPFVDDSPIFGKGSRYPHRCSVEFTETGAEEPVDNELWGLSAWKERDEPLRTIPSNMLLCYGGFLKLSEADYDRLLAKMRGEITE